MLIIIFFAYTFASHISVISEESQLATVHLFLLNTDQKFSFEALGEYYQYIIDFDRVCSLFFNHEPLIAYEASELSSDAELSIEGNLNVDNLSFDEQLQLTLVYLDDFEGSIEGWSDMRTFRCGQQKNQFLGGPCQFSDLSVTKTFEGLLPHEMVIVSFNFNFIDEWNGEYAQFLINNEIVWQESYFWCEKVMPWMCMKFGINVCGNEIPDQFGQSVQVKIPHSEDTLTLEFTTTLGELDSCRASWGIDNIEVYIL